MNALLNIFDLDEAYVIKWSKETGYALVAALAGVVIVTLKQTDINAVADWKTWAAALGLACVRVGYATLSNAVHSLAGGK